MNERGLILNLLQAMVKVKQQQLLWSVVLRHIGQGFKVLILQFIICNGYGELAVSLN